MVYANLEVTLLLRYEVQLEFFLLNALKLVGHRGHRKLQKDLESCHCKVSRRCSTLFKGKLRINKILTVFHLWSEALVPVLSVGVLLHTSASVRIFTSISEHLSLSCRLTKAS
jgi:hypothetical protein